MGGGVRGAGGGGGHRSEGLLRDVPGQEYQRDVRACDPDRDLHGVAQHNVDQGAKDDPGAAQAQADDRGRVYDGSVL